MSLLRRREMYKAGELPAGYKRCKWLSSKNDAYLITDYYPKIGDSVEIYLSLDAEMDYDVPISATSEYDSSRMLIIMFGRVNTFFKYFTKGAASSVYLPQYLRGEPRKMVIDKDGRLIDYTGYLITNEEVKKNKEEINAPLFLFERSTHKDHFSGKIGTVTFTRVG